MGSLVRVAFGRYNPTWDGPLASPTPEVPVPRAVARLLSEVLLPHAKRDELTVLHRATCADASIAHVLAASEAAPRSP